MKLLIAGGEGQLGQALRSACHSLASGSLGRALQAVLPPSIQAVALGHRQLDIADAAQIREAFDAAHPEAVINAAAFTDVDRAESESETAYRINALGPALLAAATAKRGIPLVHISTDYVFDGRKTTPYMEDDAPNPLSVYGESKLKGEEAVADRNPKHYVVRTAWLYHTTGQNFVNTMRGLANRPVVQVASDQCGSPTYAPHLAQALLELLSRGGAYGLYHIAGSGVASRVELVQEVYRAFGISTKIEPVPSSTFPRPAARPAYSALGTNRSQAIVLPPWKQGIEAFAKAIQPQ